MKQLLFLVVFTFTFFVKAGELHANRQRNDNTTICTLPYHPVGDYCLLIDNDIQGTWSEMKDLCRFLEGDLVSLKDANLLYDINNYIREQGMDRVSYWVGANDLQNEGTWVWSIDDSPVKMNAPLWGRLYGNQPNGDQDQNCGALWLKDFYFLHDEDCDESMFGVICQPRNSGEAKSSVTVPTNDCPSGYDKIGTGCYSIYVELNYTYDEALAKCNGPSSHLARIDDANFVGELYDHLQQVTDANTFWIDGSDAVTEDLWVFGDGSFVKRGTPFWDVNEEGSQEPAQGTIANCLVIQPSVWDRFRDAACYNVKWGIICQYDAN